MIVNHLYFKRYYRCFPHKGKALIKFTQVKLNKYINKTVYQNHAKKECLCANKCCSVSKRKNVKESAGDSQEEIVRLL